MKMIFQIKGITGRKLAARFVKAIDEEEVGYEDDFNSSARLSEDGSSWTTAWSGFNYTILNPEADDIAIVQYDGACRGFLTQALIPEELCMETCGAKIIEGSALERHGVHSFEHIDASTLAKAYSLLQHSSGCCNPKPLETALAASQAAKEIREYMESLGVDLSCSYVEAAPNTSGSPCSNIGDGDPAVFVTCCPGGEQVTKEFCLQPLHEFSGDEVVARAKAWLEKLKTVL